MTYAEKLQDPRWQKKRLEIMQYAEFRCQLCGDGTQTLHIHHSRYEAGKDPWEYPNGSLVCLCNSHHEIAHNRFAPVAAIVATLENTVTAMEDGYRPKNPLLERMFAAAKKMEEIRAL